MSTTSRWIRIASQTLLIRAGVDLGDSETQALVERTEGWPAGLYLAALAHHAGGADPAGGAALLR